MEEISDYASARKRKSEDSVASSSSLKKRQFQGHEILEPNKGFGEEIAQKHDNSNEEEEHNGHEEEENFEFNEFDDCEYIDGGDNDNDVSDEEDLNENPNSNSIVIGDDNYLSFSDNEITDERIKESRTTSSKNPTKEKRLKKKRKKKNPNMRRNIRDTLKDKQLDSLTRQLREKEIDRLKKLGMTNMPGVIQSPNLKPPLLTKTTKPSSTNVKKSDDVICLSSSEEDNGYNMQVDEENEQKEKLKEVFVLSSDSDEEDFEEEEEKLADHHSDLGLHTNDAFNKPESNGKVWVNLHNKDTDEKIYLSRRISKIVKPHQIGGLRFLFDNLIESVKDFRPSLGNGCILAHAMGLGKTIQTIVFIDLFFRYTPAKKVLCVVPVNTIQNWSNEFNKWVPPKPKVPLICKENDISKDPSNLQSLMFRENIAVNTDDNLQTVDNKEKLFVPEPGDNVECKSSKNEADSFSDFNVIKSLLDDMVYFINENTRTEMNQQDPVEMLENTEEEDENEKYRKFDVFVIDAQKTWPDRINTIDEWAEKGGVLLIGYEMYRMVASGLKSTKFKGRTMKMLLEERHNLKQIMKEAICDPGPDLVVCDEGHRIRNYQSGISQSLKSIRTRKRLVLTGYPLQNNLMEYWCMVDFVRPDYLGSRQEYANMFERPILNGQCVDSTPGDKRLMRERAHVLFSLLQGFVQRRGHKVFKAILPAKQEHVIMVRMSPIQKALYERLVELTKEAYSDSLNPIKTFHLCCKIWNHPDILYQAIQAIQQGRDVDIISDEDDIDNDSNTSSGKQKRKRATPKFNTPQFPFLQQQEQNIGFSPFVPEPREILMDITQWAPEIFRQHEYVPGRHENSGKFTLLQQLIKESLVEGDKMLIFSQSLFTLTTIEEMLHKTPVDESQPVMEGEPVACWKRGEHYFRLDGSTSSIEREKMINRFNDERNTKAKLFLLSTRAGCLGINLVAANRVVVFDVSWNPCYDAQAVCRIYRYGQTKPCYIYRFVASNTMEKKIYYRQISKQGISNRVVDEMNQTEKFTKNEMQSLIAEDVVDEPVPDFGPYVTTHHDRILNSVILSCSEWITKVPFKHESLLVNEEETEKLTGSEKRAAKRAYEAQKQMSRSGFRPYPLQQSFPSNTPVVPVRPFSWRPPPSSAYNANIRLSFPVMVGNSIQVTNSSATNSYPSQSMDVIRSHGLSPYSRSSSFNSAPRSQTLVDSLLSNIRQSLSTSNLASASADRVSDLLQPPISETSSVTFAENDERPSILTSTTTHLPPDQASTLPYSTNTLQRQRDIQDLLLKATNTYAGNRDAFSNLTLQLQDIDRLNSLLNLPSSQQPYENRESLATHYPVISTTNSRPMTSSNTSNDVIILDDSDDE